MKRIVITLIIFFISEQLFAQKPELEFVFRPALTSSRGNELIGQNFDAAFKFTGGVGANFFLKNKSLINVAIIYDRKGGSKEEMSYTDPGGTIIKERVINKLNYDYITIPVQWAERFGRKIKYQFGIGFYTSFLLKAENEVVRLDASPDFSQDKTHMSKRLDLGLSTSFSAYFPLSEKLALKVALDDNLGLLNTSSVPVINNGSIKHNSFGLQAGLNVKL